MRHRRRLDPQNAFPKWRTALPPNDRPLSFTDRLDRFTKIALAAFGGIFLVGLVVVNLHLAQFGVAGLGFLREHYVLAGVWAVVPLAVMSVFGAGIVAAVFESLQEKTVTHRDAATNRSFYPALRIIAAVGTGLLGIAFLSSFPILFSWITFSKVLPPLRELHLQTVLIVVRTCGIFAFLLALFGLGAKAYLGKSHWWQHALAVFFVVLTLMLAVGYVGFFTYGVYPRIPRAIGGGEASRAVIIFERQDHPLVATEFKAGSDTARDLRREVRILFETQDALFLIQEPDTTRAIEISKRDVAAIIMR